MNNDALNALKDIRALLFLQQANGIRRDVRSTDPRTDLEPTGRKDLDGTPEMRLTWDAAVRITLEEVRRAKEAISETG